MSEGKIILSTVSIYRIKKWKLMDLNNELSVQLGYPGLREGQIIPDKRNDKRILDIFTSDNKLIK